MWNSEPSLLRNKPAAKVSGAITGFGLTGLKA